MSIGENIIKRRKAINMKAAELCRRAGITSAYMSQIEKDKRIPTLDVLQKIANELNVTVSDLLGETETELDLSEEQLKFMEIIKSLRPEQIDALVNVANAFFKEQEDLQKKSPKPIKVSKLKPDFTARAAHYEGEEGLNDDEQSAIQSEIDKIKEQYNPDGTPKNKK